MATDIYHSALAYFIAHQGEEAYSVSISPFVVEF
jgi:hypothetical protein